MSEVFVLVRRVLFVNDSFQETIVGIFDREQDVKKACEESQISNKQLYSCHVVAMTPGGAKPMATVGSMFQQLGIKGIGDTYYKCAVRGALTLQTPKIVMPS